MRFVAVHRDYLEQRPALAADDASLGAWVRLAALAAHLEQPTSEDEPGAAFCEGRIPASKDWSNREWIRATGTDVDGVARAIAAGLARWDGSDLLVHGYDLHGHRNVAQRRLNAIQPPKPGKRPRGRPRKPTGFDSANLEVSKNNPDENPSPLLSLPIVSPNGETHTSSSSSRSTVRVVDLVFAHWVKVMGKRSDTLLTADRKAKLKARRKEGYTDEQLIEAIDGCKLSPYHMGQNDKGEPFTDLCTILRDGKAVDAHRARLAQGGPKPTLQKTRMAPTRGTTEADFADAPSVEDQLAAARARRAEGAA